MEIIVKNLNYTIEKINYQPRVIFSNLNVVFDSCMIHGIIGASGSGKTVLLELLSSLRKPSSGFIRISDCAEKNNFSIGILEEIDKEEEMITVMEKMRNAICLYKPMSEDDLIFRISNSLKLVGLDKEYLKKDWFCLSEGEKKKVLLAIVLFHNPKILILDDPFRNLDMKSKSDLCKLLKMLKNRYKKTIIMATNDMDMLHKIVDKVYVLSDGKIVMSGDKYSIFSNIKALKKYGIVAPKCIAFSNRVLEKKNIKIGYRDEINDLIKDIYRYAKW